MLRLLALIFTQSVLLVAAQSLLKVSVQKFGSFRWAWSYFATVLTTWQFALSGICALACMLTWMHVLKHYEFSLAYPLLSVSYIIGLVVACFFFHEAVPLTRWIGVVIIMVGVYLVVK